MFLSKLELIFQKPLIRFLSVIKNVRRDQNFGCFRLYVTSLTENTTFSEGVKSSRHFDACLVP